MTEVVQKECFFCLQVSTVNCYPWVSTFFHTMVKSFTFWSILVYPYLGIDSSDYGPIYRKTRYLLPGIFGHFLVTIFTILVRFWPRMALSWPHFDPKSTPLTLSRLVLTNFRPNLTILWHFQFLAPEPPAIFFLAPRYLLQVLTIQSRGYMVLPLWGVFCLK